MSICDRQVSLEASLESLRNEFATLFFDIAQTIDQVLRIPQLEPRYTGDSYTELSRSYANVVAVRNSDADDEAYKGLTVWRNLCPADVLEEVSKRNTITVDQPVADRRFTVTELEELAHDFTD